MSETQQVLTEPQPAHNGPSKRLVMFPADFFSQEAHVVLTSEFSRHVEWMMFLVLVAREALNQGRLEAGGKPLSRRALALLHRNPIDPKWIDACLAEGLLEEDDGCLKIARWSDWYRPPSKMPDARREQGQSDREKKTNDKPPKNKGKKKSEGVGNHRNASEVAGTQPTTEPPSGTEPATDPTSSSSSATATTTTNVVELSLRQSRGKSRSPALDSLHHSWQRALQDCFIGMPEPAEDDDGLEKAAVLFSSEANPPSNYYGNEEEWKHELLDIIRESASDYAYNLAAGLADSVDRGWCYSVGAARKKIERLRKQIGGDRTA